MALAYRGLLALFPFTIFLVAVVSFLHVDAVLAWLAGQGPVGIRGAVPRSVASLLGQVLGDDQSGLLYFGIVVAFWSVSMGARLLTRALNAVLEVEETRPPWKRVAYSLTFAPGIVLAGVCAVGLMLATSRSAVWLAGWVGLDEAFVLLWTLLRWPTALLLLALVAVISGALASLAFSFLLGIFPDHGTLYGGLGTAISLLLYLYFSAAVLLFGAELNAEMRRGDPKGGGNEVGGS